MTETNISRFLAPPDNFTGSGAKNPSTWLKHMGRLRSAIGMTDEQALLVATTHLKEQAELWWESVEDTIQTWEGFEKAFLAQFASPQMEDFWWSKIRQLKQETGQTVDDVAFKLRELFGLVKLGSENESFKVHCFLQTINKDVAYELEQRGVPKTFKDTAVKARKIEIVIQKYNTEGHKFFSSSSTKDDSTNDSLSTALGEINEGLRALKIHVIDKPKKTTEITCWNCSQTGHRATECSQPKKGKEQKASVNLINNKEAIDKADNVEIFNNIPEKRSHSTTQAEPSRKRGRPQQVVNKERITVPRRRPPPRRLPVSTSKRDVWKKLSQLDAGLTVSDWIALDKEAYRDVRDGLRFLHGRRPRSTGKQPRNEGNINVLDVKDLFDQGEDEYPSDCSTMGSDFDSEYESDDTDLITLIAFNR